VPKTIFLNFDSKNFLFDFKETKLLVIMCCAQLFNIIPLRSLSVATIFHQIFHVIWDNWIIDFKKIKSHQHGLKYFQSIHFMRQKFVQLKFFYLFKKIFFIFHFWTWNYRKLKGRIFLIVIICSSFDPKKMQHKRFHSTEIKLDTAVSPNGDQKDSK